MFVIIRTAEVRGVPRYTITTRRGKSSTELYLVESDFTPREIDLLMDGDEVAHPSTGNTWRCIYLEDFGDEATWSKGGPLEEEDE